MASGGRLALVGVAVVFLGAALLVGTGTLSLDGPPGPAQLVGLGGSPPSDGANATVEDTPRAGTPAGATPGTGTGTGDGPGTATTEPTDDPAEVDSGGSDDDGRDSDGDGLGDARERELGTDPATLDTDGDGLGDVTEVEGATSPVVADTDSDGVTDGAELDLGTDATLADTDDDGLSDGREREGRTDPVALDTDGDQLVDGWEVRERVPGGPALPNASATRMDLYVQTLYGKFARPLTERDRDVIEEEFEEMAVENPDGSRGVTVHFADERPDSLLDDPVSVSGPGGSFDDLKRTYETGAYMGSRRGVYHLLVVGQVDAANRSGYGEAPGLVSVVDEFGSGTNEVRTRRRVVVHELLHNVVGAFTASGNATRGTYHVLNETRYNTTNYDFSVGKYYSLYGSYLIGPAPESPLYGEWNISGPTRLELAAHGFKAPRGDGFPPVDANVSTAVVADAHTTGPTAVLLEGPVRSTPATAPPHRPNTTRAIPSRATRT